LVSIAKSTLFLFLILNKLMIGKIRGKDMKRGKKKRKKEKSDNPGPVSFLFTHLIVGW